MKNPRKMYTKISTARARTPGSHDARKGIAAVECAICLPIIVLLVLAMIEACSMVFVKQSLTVAAYEGAHRAVSPNATAASVSATCQQILDDRRIGSASIEVIPNDLTSLEIGEFFEVRISAPAGANSIVPGRFFLGKTLTASAELMKEL